MLASAYSSSKREGCPCCEERLAKRGGLRFVLRASAPEGACEECVLPPPPPPEAVAADVPPFTWPRTPKDVEEAVEKVLAAAAAALDAVAAVPEDKLTFESVVRPLMEAPMYKTNPLVCQAKHLQHCSPDPELREAATKAASAFAACKKRGKTRKDVYEQVRRFAGSEEAKALPAYEAHFVKAVLAGFERGGLALGPAEAAELQRLLDADAEVCTQYKRNLAEDKTRLSFAPEELQGCEEEFVKERLEKDSGKVVLTLKYPDVLPVLQNCSVEGTRKAVALARDGAYGDNLELVAKGVQLRKQTAALLGYKSWAHFVTETRMSGSPEKVTEFLGGIREKAQPGATADKERLRALKVAHLVERGDLKLPEDKGAADAAKDAVRLEAWDTAFYHALLLKREYGVDHEAIRRYFPLPVVVDGTLAIYQELLGLKFVEIENFDRWHSEVRLFVVYDVATSERQGHFYLDLHPRDGKYNHAAIFHLLKRRRAADGGQAPVDCMLTNLPAPSADGSPALLRHDDVVTFFHEFGHIMHGLCTEGPANATTLAKCPRDFVEAPSQMLENWCFNREVLKRLSKHVETGEPLPEDKVSALLAAKNVNEGLMMLRQLYLGSLDLAIHGEAPPADAAGLQALVDELRPKISLVDNPPGCNMLRSFGHLMNQYSAAYYGYLWAEVLSADMFATRFAADPFSQEAGMAYRKQVLGPGGVGSIAEHLAKFLGREPSEEPFLRSRGILS